jgi:ATP-dependent RNA helicase RhlE
LLRALAEAGHQTPTPIQAQAIPGAIAGRDLLGCAQTGTGKTAAFALPILQRLVKQPVQGRSAGPRVLVLSPTRELASQIGESFSRYGRFVRVPYTVIFGGVSQHHQVSALRRGVDVLIATPGRLCDLLDQGYVRLGNVEVLVLDEADRMLDEGFLPAVRRIIGMLPQARQTLFFSATMPPELLPLTQQVLKDPVRVEVTPVASTPEKVTQAVYHVAQKDKRALLQHLLELPEVKRAIVFTRTKHGANRVAEQLERSSIPAEAIHGNKSQNARERALSSFKRGQVRVLVATDVAARGIDINDVTHVINYDLPDDIEAYVHRIGRTARAGASGAALSFCSPDEFGQLRAIERLIRRRVPVVSDHPFVSELPAPQPDPQGETRRTFSPRGFQARNGRGPAPRRYGPNGGTAPAPARRREDRP